jgi:hypothetical protein
VCIQEETKQDYSQTEYGKNTLVVGDGRNSENPLQCRLKATNHDVRASSEDRVDLGGWSNEQCNGIRRELAKKQR